MLSVLRATRSLIQLFSSPVVAWRWQETRHNCSHRILFAKQGVNDGVWPIGHSLQITAYNNAFLLSLIFPLNNLREASCQGPAFLSSRYPSTHLMLVLLCVRHTAWEGMRWNPLINLIAAVTVETASVDCTVSTCPTVCQVAFIPSVILSAQLSSEIDII